MVFLIRSPLTTLVNDRLAPEKYNKLIPRKVERFQILEIRDNVLAINDDRIAIAVLIDRQTPVGWKQHQWLCKGKLLTRQKTKLQKKRKRNLPSKKLLASIKGQSDYSAKCAGMATNLKMTPSIPYPPYHVNSSHAMTAVRNDNQASLPRLFTNYAPFIYSCLTEKRTKPKSEALAASHHFVH